MTKRENDRRMAAMFLKEVYTRANHYADQLDPKRQRSYGTDPILRALDVLTSAASHGLYTSGADWTAEDWSGQHPVEPKP